MRQLVTGNHPQRAAEMRQAQKLESYVPLIIFVFRLEQHMIILVSHFHELGKTSIGF